MNIELQTGPNDSGRRLDRILRKALPQQPLSLIHRLLRQKKILVNGIPASAEDRIQAGVIIQCELMVNEKKPVREKPVSNLDLPLPEILWQGSGIMVLNKPQGITTHGPNSLDTIVTAYLADSLPPSLSFKPGPLHRLDKQTSGAIAFSRTLNGARLFTRLMREKKITKKYLAIVAGCIDKTELWQDTLYRDTYTKKTFITGDNDGKQSCTTVRQLAANGEYSLIEAVIVTGRTHQIRAQAAAHGHPLAGDKKYGGHDGTFMNGFFLHAMSMEFSKDSTDTFPSIITAPLPQSFIHKITALFGKNVKVT